MADAQKNYAIWIKNKKKIAITVIKAFKKYPNIVDTIPDTCLLTMSDVHSVAYSDEEIHILDKDNYYLKMTILNRHHPHLDERRNDGTDKDGTQHIGWFFGKTIAKTDPPFKWIVVDEELLDYIEKIKRNKTQKSSERESSKDLGLLYISNKLSEQTARTTEPITLETLPKASSGEYLKVSKVADILMKYLLESDVIKNFKDDLYPGDELHVDIDSMLSEVIKNFEKELKTWAGKKQK